MPNGKEQYRADLSKRRGKIAAGIADPKQRRQFIAAQGEGVSEEALESGASKQQNINAVMNPEIHAYDFRKQKGRRAPLMMKGNK
jgi:hypothetical protein